MQEIGQTVGSNVVQAAALDSSKAGVRTRTIQQSMHLAACPVAGFHGVRQEP